MTTGLRTSWQRRNRKPAPGAMGDSAANGWLCSWLATVALLAAVTQRAAAICPTMCNCNEETLVVVCNGTNNLEEVPITLNPSIQELHITHTRLRAVIASFSFYKELEYLNLADNQLDMIETNSFDEQNKLLVLKLSHNAIASVVNDTFAGLRALTVLQLDDNALQTLPPLAFAHLGALQELDVSANRIQSISPTAFVGLAALRTLRLRDNRLAEVPTLALTPLPDLFFLDVGKNPLHALAEGAFSTVRNLQRLALDGCSLADLTEGAFADLANLRALRLQSNNLRAIPPALATLERLEELEIGQNELEELPAHAFKGLRYLRLLDVASAPKLEAVRKYAFSSNADLETVRLVHNPRLSLLEAGAFEGLSSLKHLSLRGNAFTSFSEFLLPWDELETLDLRDNPVLCNCSLLWLRNLLNGRNLSRAGGVLNGGRTAEGWPAPASAGLGLPRPADPGSSSSSNDVGGGGAEGRAQPLQQARPAIVATCDSPSHLRGRNLAELNADELACYFADVRQQALVGIVAGAVVACVATLVLVVFKYRKPVTTVLKDKWSDGALRRKEHHQYHKTSDEEENNILHAAAQQTMKLTPVTEL